MTGAVTFSAIIGMLSLVAGVGLGWWLRRTSDWCATCGEHMRCAACQPLIDHVRVDSTA
ncbi:hypothetical protein [Actinoplanes derwentensis]|uniref:Uncharacterized protein n=1 Tax=Actinoplanes derwentensis TaxID=113562 RepID=A0A1H2CWX1_9ACTN|nr:hypothetical protein [Actinoplanes derwentensis]GID82798.1 hypothetical protein Ade03nite_17220 [Actinoplanes derwentensis]SDT75050.1 hypothetical protein SAMN04489716_7178 [Actinoplanes derwentensis]